MTLTKFRWLLHKLTTQSRQQRQTVFIRLWFWYSISAIHCYFNYVLCKFIRWHHVEITCTHRTNQPIWPTHKNVLSNGEVDSLDKSTPSRGKYLFRAKTPSTLVLLLYILLSNRGRQTIHMCISCISWQLYSHMYMMICELLHTRHDRLLPITKDKLYFWFREVEVRSDMFPTFSTSKCINVEDVLLHACRWQ